MRGSLRASLGALLLLVVLSQATLLSSQEWQRFRTAYPYHIQTIALSDKDASGARTMIISEPPPSVTLDQIEALDPALRNASTEQHRLGVDGWVKDVVIDLPPLAPASLNAIVNRLQVLLFGTSYKAYVVSIPAKLARPQLQKLNLRVTSGDLKTWVFGNAPINQGWSLVRGLVFGTFLFFLAVVFFRAKRYFFSFLTLVSGIGVMIYNSGLISLALAALLAAIVAILLLRGSKKIPGIVLGAAAVCTLIFVGVRWQSQHRAPDTLFSPLLGGKALSCQSILEQHRNGVFISTKPGLVLWSFAKTSPMDTHEIEIREFALDSDLILGAVSSSDQVAILARERTTPVATLPPLRTETILQLAAAHEDELSQSYERNNPFAGRYDYSTNMDWAPIYLSPRLIDTEYGSLLNITDQLLKGWTQHGDVKYVNFTYPDPPSFPFPKALITLLGVKELTFNWNTKGAGYVTKADDYEVYALNQTGSLPIDYLAEGNPDIQKAEDTAYRYYSGMSDPNLIRVVQYAAIYQVFHHYSVVESANSKPAPKAVPSPLIPQVHVLLQLIARSSDAEIEAIPDAELIKKARTVRDVLRKLIQADTDESLQNILTGALASRDGFPAMDAIPDERTRRGVQKLMIAVQQISAAFVSPLDRRVVLASYANQTGARQSPWIHTPSVVESRGTDTIQGGHNLSSRITTFEADETVAAGHVTVEENGDARVIHFNPEDESRIGDTVRDAARENDVPADQVRSNVEKVLGTDNRKPVPIETALGFDDSIRPDPLRGFEPAHAPDSIAGIGWRRGGEALSNQDAKFIRRIGGNDSRLVLVARDSNGAYVISAPPAEPVQAFDLASTTDALLAVTHDTPDAQLAIHFRGFDDRQAEGFMRNIDAHSEVKVSIGSTEEYVSPERLEEIIKGKYDWTRAELKEEPQLLVAADGQSREVHAEISVPARDAKLPGLVVRLKLTVSNAIQFTHEMLADFSAQIRAVLMNAKSSDARIVARALVDELKKDQRFTTVQAQIRHDDKTVFYVINHDPFEDKKDARLAA